MDIYGSIELAGSADAYMQKCPSRTVLAMLSDKWVLLVLGALGRGPQRFGVLRKKLDGITQKMLSQTLRALERDGLITRTVYPTAPPSVEYALTALGHSATELVSQIRLWAETHAEEVLDSRERFDSRPD